MVKVSISPDRVALLNVDLQNSSWRVSQTVVERINQLADACRDAGILVIHTAHVLRPDGSNMGILGEMIPEIKDGLLNKPILRRGDRHDHHPGHLNRRVLRHDGSRGDRP